MTSYLETAGLIMLYSMIAAPSSVHAASLNQKVKEGQGVVSSLGTDSSAITYWVNQPDGWHVVTTVDMENPNDRKTEHRAIVRFSAVLQPGQSQSISVPAALGEKHHVLLIRRIGDQIEVETSSAVSN